MVSGRNRKEEKINGHLGGRSPQRVLVQQIWGLRTQPTNTQILLPPRPSFVALGKLLYLSVPQFPLL